VYVCVDVVAAPESTLPTGALADAVEADQLTALRRLAVHQRLVGRREGAGGQRGAGVDRDKSEQVTYIE
jgi:hypothetical protein